MGTENNAPGRRVERVRVATGRGGGEWVGSGEEKETEEWVVGWNAAEME